MQRAYLFFVEHYRMASIIFLEDIGDIVSDGKDVEGCQFWWWRHDGYARLGLDPTTRDWCPDDVVIRDDRGEGLVEVEEIGTGR